MYYYISSTDEDLSDAFGYAEPLADIPETPRSDCSSRLVLNADSTDEEHRATIYHEFMHALQMGMDCVESDSAFEPFAVYTELLMGDYTSLIEDYLPAFQQMPEQSIDFMDEEGEGFYEYGAALFPLFLEEYYGNKDGKLMQPPRSAIR